MQKPADKSRECTTPGSAFLERAHKFSEEILSRRMLGYSFLRAWVFLVFFNEMFFAQNPAPDHGVSSSIYQISLIALVLTLFICGALNTRCERIAQSKAALAITTLFCVLGTLAVPFATTNTHEGIILIATSGIATGIGSAFLTLFWGRIYSAEGGPTAAAEVSVSYLLAALLVPLFGMMDPTMRAVISSVMPLCSSIFLASELSKVGPWNEGAKTFSQLEPCKHPFDVVVGKPQANKTWNPKHPFTFDYANTLFKFSIGSLVFGCVISIVRFICTFSGAFAHTASYSPFIAPLATLIVCCIMLATLFFSRNLDLAFSYKSVIIFMMLGCFLLPFQDGGTTPVHSVSYLFTLAGYICFEIVSWVILADMTFRFGISPFRAFGFGRCAVSGGVLLGSLLSGNLGEMMPLSLETTFAVVCAMAFALVIAFTLTLTERDVARIHRPPASLEKPTFALDGGSQNKSHEPAPHQESEVAESLEEKVANVAQEYAISGRMLEVMSLLAQGRSAARIEQELYISRGTVNTYSYRLYQKLGIHSRQELLDLIYRNEEKSV